MDTRDVSGGEERVALAETEQAVEPGEAGRVRGLAGEDVACAAPRRDRLASAIDKAHVYTSLFGGATAAVKIDRFTLLDRIGNGAMGEVYSAFDPRLDRKVAIKLVRRDEDAPVHPDDQLLGEAKTMARVSHGNVIQVYDAGTCDGRMYIAMEYIRGTTLRSWLDSVAHLGRAARQREVLRQFIAAGRGLQAAHEAGLVHRDFKPDNVLVGEDGQPRVGDFGLARLVSARADGDVGEDERGPGDGQGPAEDGEERAAGARGDSGGDAGDDEARADGVREALGSTAVETVSMGESEHWALRAAWVRTSAGQVVGTPRYMSPEQWRGEIPDSRSDQFSFCVALWEALVGRPPFTGDSHEQLERATNQGAIDEAAGVAEIPAAVRKALLRGLSVSPDDRFADMGALLAALEEWPRRRRRWTVLGLVAVAVAVVSVALYAVSGPAHRCADAGAAMDASWTAERRAAIREAFVRSGMPDADTTWGEVASELDRYAEQWKRDRVAACEDTHERHVQSEDLLDRRVICLDRGKARLDALLDELAPAGGVADRSAMVGAALAAAELPDLAACRSRKNLRYGLEMPPVARKAAVAAIRDGLARARTRELLGGKHEDALRVAREQRAAADALGYVPVQAEAMFQEGRLLTYRGTHEDIDDGEDLIRQAIDLATGIRHDELVAEALAFLVLSEYRHSDTTARGHELSDRAFAASRRIEDRPRDRAELLRSAGLLLARDGAYEAAEKSQRAGLVALAEDPEAPWMYRAAHLLDLANTVRDRGRFDEASQLYAEARALYARLGPAHPYVALVPFDMGVKALREGDLVEARALLEEALRIRTRSLGEMHQDVGAVYLALADVAQRTGALDEAENAARASLRIYEQVLDAGGAGLARAHQTFGAIRYRRGDYDGARAAYVESLKGLIVCLGPDHLEVGYAQANLAEVELMLGHHDDALAALAEARRILGDLGDADPLMAGFLEGLRGRALFGAGRASEAVAALETALEHFARLTDGGAPLELAAVRWTLARALAAVDRGRSERARAQAEAALTLLDGAADVGRADAEAIRRWLGGRPGR